MNRYDTARSCNIHDTIRFAIDEDCHQCIEDESTGMFIQYVERIDQLEKNIKKLQQDYDCLALSYKREL